MSQYLVFSLLDKETKKMSPILTYSRNNDIYALYRDNISFPLVPFEEEACDKDDPTRYHVKVTREMLLELSSALWRETESLEKYDQAYRETINPSEELFKEHCGHKKRYEEIQYCKHHIYFIRDMIEEIESGYTKWDGLYFSIE